MILPLESNKRPIVKASINNKEVYMLVDTGASVGVIDLNALDKLDVKRGYELEYELVGLGSNNKAYHTKRCIVDANGVKLYQFITMDISNIVESIKHETNITISGIIGTPQIKSSEMKIDLDNGIIKIGY